MPLKWLEHEGVRHEVKDCLQPGNPLQEFFPLGYLRSCADEREWTGKPSCTQLLNGTRQEYLKILCPYADEPGEAAFRVLGSMSHVGLEGEHEDCHNELKIEVEGITGTLDALEPLGDGKWRMTDYKTSGSYKVASFLEKGEWTWEFQLNFYRIGAELLGFDVASMRLFNVVRDGATFIAKKRGIEKQTYYTEIDFIDNEKVLQYFRGKRDALLGALKGVEISLKESSGAREGIAKEVVLGDAIMQNVPPPCTPEESWDGRRCKGYCSMKEECILVGCPYINEPKKKKSTGDSDLKNF